jgi:integrase
MDNKVIMGKLPTLFTALEKQLEALDYSENTLLKYRQVKDELAEFMSQNNLFAYCVETGSNFVREQVLRRPSSCARQAQAVILRLNDVLLGNEYVNKHTEIHQRCPECFSRVLEKYLNTRKDEGKAPKTIDNEHHYIGKFLFALERIGINKLGELGPQDVQKAFASRRADPTTAQAIRNFLRFVHRDGLTATDYSVIIPRVRKPRTVVSAYTDHEIIRLLQSIDRTSLVGKRDYAMLVIAVEVGLRAGDIVSLKAENIDCDRNVISLVQSKTKSPIELPLLDVVQEAIAEYLKMARPKSSCPEIFISCRAPYRPVSRAALTTTVAKYFRKAGIDFTGKHHGPHSLRASMATRLLSEDVPYGVIQKVLGHTSALSAKAYLDIDIERLRDCALEVPAPSGLFAERLASVEGGL